jgi:hypothetical protein
MNHGPHAVTLADIRQGHHERKRVALADHNALRREGMAGLLERAGLDVVDQCGDVSELIAVIRCQYFPMASPTAAAYATGSSTIFDAPDTIEPGSDAVTLVQQRIDVFAHRWRDIHPATVRCLLDDRDSTGPASWSPLMCSPSTLLAGRTA